MVCCSNARDATGTTSGSRNFRYAFYSVGDIPTADSYCLSTLSTIWHHGQSFASPHTIFSQKYSGSHLFSQAASRPPNLLACCRLLALPFAPTPRSAAPSSFGRSPSHQPLTGPRTHNFGLELPVHSVSTPTPPQPMKLAPAWVYLMPSFFYWRSSTPVPPRVFIGFRRFT